MSTEWWEVYDQLGWRAESDEPLRTWNDVVNSLRHFYERNDMYMEARKDPDDPNVT